jgi:adhesin transport system outer membrane protein
MRYGNQKWTLWVALAAMPAVVVAAESGGNAKKEHASPLLAKAPFPGPDDTLVIVRRRSRPATPDAAAPLAAEPEKVAPAPPLRTAATPPPASPSVLNATLPPSNEAAAAGVRSVLDASRNEVLKQNLAREGMHFADETLQPPKGPTVELQQVVALAVANFPSIRSAMASVGQYQAGVDVARAGYYPAVQVGLNAGHQGVYGAGQAASASVSQMLWDFGKVKNAVTSAESSVLTSELQLRAEIDRIATQAALTAIELERNLALEASARAQLDAVTKLLDLANKRAKLGASNRADPTQAEARVSAAQATLQSIKNLVSQRRTQLATLIGRDVPAGGVVIAPEVLKQAIAAIRPDVQNAVTVQIAEAAKNTAAADLAEAKSNTKPTVSLQAGVNQYLGAASNYMPNGREYTLTLGVTHNIFQGGAPSARVRGASEALRGADERIQAEQLQAENDRRVYEEQMTSLASRMETLRMRQARIVETQKLYKEQYLSLGTRSLLDLLNSEAEIFQAESDEINARHDLWVAEISYINTTGYMRDVFNLGNAS